MSILQGELAADIADALEEADIPHGITLNQRVVSGPAHEPTITWVPHECLGLVDSFTALERAQSNIAGTDIKVLILTTSLAIVPTTSDTLSINSTTFAIVAIGTDPAQALWEIQARV